MQDAIYGPELGVSPISHVQAHYTSQSICQASGSEDLALTPMFDTQTVKLRLYIEWSGGCRQVPHGRRDSPGRRVHVGGLVQGSSLWSQPFPTGGIFGIPWGINGGILGGWFHRCEAVQGQQEQRGG